MATLKCLACGHDNNVGDEWCSSCSSSLNLRLCSACEAINASDAERCHSCNAEFRIEPEAVTFEMDAPPAGGAPVEAPAVKALPEVWRLAAGQARKPSSRSAATLAVLPLLAAGAAYYYFYAASPAAEAPRAAPTQVAPTQAPSKVEAAQKSEPAPVPEAAAPAEPVRPQTVGVKQAPVVSGKIVAPRTAAAPARSTPPAEPKRTGAAVTHTQGAGAAISNRTFADAPARAAADAPANGGVTTLPAAAADTTAANAAILPVSERVTHTKTDLTESAATTAAPAAATQVRTVPAEARSDEPAGCPPAVAALALCTSR